MRVRSSSLLSLAALSLLPPAAHAQDRGQAHQFQLAAGNDEWTTTGLKLAANDLVVVFATGNITVGPVVGQVDADGRNARLMATGVGYIEGKVGAGNPFPVGGRFTFTTSSEQIGTLKLRVHDSNYADNSGSFTVTVIRIPASALPPVEPYTPEE
jgi:hypothetical protein